MNTIPIAEALAHLETLHCQWHAQSIFLIEDQKNTYLYCREGLGPAIEKLRAALEAVWPTAAGAAPEGDLLALQQFAVDILGDEEIGSLDGGDIQDTAEACGLLIPTEATEACGEACICAGYGDFPMTCYRRSPILRRAYKADDDRRKAATPNPGAQHGQEVMRDDAAFHGRIGRLSFTPAGEGGERG